MADEKRYGNIKLYYGSDVIEISQDGTNVYFKGDNPIKLDPVESIEFDNGYVLGGMSIVSVTIAVADWSGGTTCSKTVTGVTTTSTNQIAIETIANGDAWAAANIYATGQSADQIDFTCTTTPTAAISFKVIINS